jgi:hypothetical protein
LCFCCLYNKPPVIACCDHPLSAFKSPCDSLGAHGFTERKRMTWSLTCTGRVCLHRRRLAHLSQQRDEFSANSFIAPFIFQRDNRKEGVMCTIPRRKFLSNHRRKSTAVTFLESR